jgi:hypothetical protein
MKNLHLIQTDKPSKLYHWVGNDTYKSGFRLRKLSDFCDENSIKTKNQHIYITNDEEIKDKCYFINISFNTIHKTISKINSEYCKKIILADDPDLIADGVQAIDDEFLEWFVKNPTCQFVDVNKICYGALTGFADAGYKIVIQKQEANYNMKQEILDEMKRIEEPKQQTAVEWLVEQTRKPEWHSLKRQDIWQQAKEIEKQQIIDAWNDGLFGSLRKGEDNSEQYYNETFNK